MEGLEMLIGYAILYQLVMLIVPVFKLVIAIVAAKHFKGKAVLLMLVGAIGGLLAHFVGLYFNYYYLPRHHSSPDIQYFFYGQTILGIIIGLTYLIGVYLLIKQWIKERNDFKSAPQTTVS